MWIRLLVSLGVLAWPLSAHALQPLTDFVRGARTYHPANQEATANRDGAAARASEALGRALPGLALSGSYNRNQYEVAFGTMTVLPRNQLDAAATLSVPLIDLAKFWRISAARRSADAAAHAEEATALETTAQVVQTYYQLAANLALAEAARQNLDAVALNLKVTEEALRAGTATKLDSERARAEVERQTQQLTSVELEVKLAARALQSQSGVAAETLPIALSDDLHREAPLASFSGEATPAVQAAAAARAAADKNAGAQRLALLPSLNASASERYTNTTAFTGGHHEVWVAGLSLFWAFDFSTAPGIRARDADAAAARARETATRLATGDAIHKAWSTIEANLARSRSARAQAAVSAQAAELARTRYRSGVATQLELIQAERDAFSAEATRIQSDAQLLNARLQLRLASGTDPFARQ